MTSPASALNIDELLDGWHRVGLRPGMQVMVHSSLSSLGRVHGGAASVVASLRSAVGSEGTVVVPAFTAQVTDPDADHAGAPDNDLIARRAAVPVFTADLPTTMGAIPEALRLVPESVRSSHPQVSVAAVGGQAAHIVTRHSLGFAVGVDSPFGRLHDLDGHILLIGVGHNRNTFLHYAETLTPHPRLKVRRFPRMVDGERVWIETFDVGNDNDTYFPRVGEEFEQIAAIDPVRVGDAPCRLLPIRPLVEFAVTRLTELLDSNPHASAPAT